MFHVINSILTKYGTNSTYGIVFSIDILEVHVVIPRGYGTRPWVTGGCVVSIMPRDTPETTRLSKEIRIYKVSMT